MRHDLDTDVRANGSRPKLTVWTPLLPQPSGIAYYNSELLLPALSNGAELQVIVDDDVAPVVDACAAFDVVPRSAHSPNGDRAAMSIYHMGNHVGFHRGIHDALLETPGIVVLHDLSLYDFYLGYHQQGPGFEEELRYNYGDSFAGWAAVRNAVGYVPDRMALRLVRRIVEASRAVVVHSAWARNELAARFPTARVFYVPLAAPLENNGDGPDIRGRYGWTDENVVFGLPAAFAAHKRAAYTTQIFHAVHEARPETRLLVAGRLDRPEELARLRHTIDEARISDAVQVVTNADAAEFDACVAACDVLVDLRWPTAGEMPATLLRAFAAGKPVIVSDLPQLREFGERFCWRIPTDPLVGTRAAVQRMICVARDPVATREAGHAAREYAKNAAASPEIVAGRYLEIVRALPDGDGDCSVSAAAANAPVFRKPVGVSVLGDFLATTGLMEVGRRTISALAAAGAELDLTAFESHAGSSQTRASHDLAHLPRGRSHQIDLWLANINEFWLISDDELRAGSANRYTIASWFWELPSVPPPFDTQASRVDEVWVGSRFVRDTFTKVVPAGTPVTIVPSLVDVPSPTRVSRSEFGLPEEATIFFFNFDARSVPARKNPWGTIQAFGQAFDARERSGPVRLVMKVDNLDYVSALREPLQAAVDRVNGILLESDLTREAMNGLLSSIDLYVSLHRAEGFGLGIAEAMFLGKPAIVTAYSGNLDFTSAANSCLVGYRLRSIEESDHELFPEAASIYQPGLLWAEPSVEQAARWMRLLYDNPERRRAIGRAGAETIRARYSRDVVQRVLVRRLEEIDRALRRRSRSAA